MSSGLGESKSQQPQNFTWSSSDGSSNDAGDFECNICFDLAQDPIVTLCGHLFCWPCLYRWLHHHSHSQECPVCKALIQEEKLVPLYGRGKISSDPRSRPIPGMEVPNRPAGQRPETAPPPEANHFMHHAFGSMGGLLPTASARIGNIVISAAFGGLFPSLFNIQVHNVPGGAMYGGPPDPFHGSHNTFHERHAHGFAHPTHHGRQQREDDNFKYILLIVGFFVILFLIF